MAPERAADGLSLTAAERMYGRTCDRGGQSSDETFGSASVQVSRRFRSFGNSADTFRGHETNPFSLSSFMQNADVAPY